MKTLRHIFAALVVMLFLISCGGGEGKVIPRSKPAEIYAESIGLAFQIVDDLLDITSTSEELGKPVGSDADSNKSTYVSILGIEESKKRADNLTKKAIESLDIFGSESAFLKERHVHIGM